MNLLKFPFKIGFLLLACFGSMLVCGLVFALSLLAKLVPATVTAIRNRPKRPRLEYREEDYTENNTPQREEDYTTSNATQENTGETIDRAELDEILEILETLDTALEENAGQLADAPTSKRQALYQRRISLLAQKANWTKKAHKLQP